MGGEAEAAPVRVVLLGPPNAGKGTQAVMLREQLGVPCISTGDMLRRESESGTPLGLRVKGIMDAGELVDDATMAEVVRGRLRQPDVSHGFVLDGYPRTLAQAKTLPAGTRVHCVAHWDNSENNLANPNPAARVSWGDQTFDEMMLGFFDVASPVDTEKLLADGVIPDMGELLARPQSRKQQRIREPHAGV